MLRDILIALCVMGVWAVVLTAMVGGAYAMSWHWGL